MSVKKYTLYVEQFGTIPIRPPHIRLHTPTPLCIAQLAPQGRSIPSAA